MDTVRAFHGWEFLAQLFNLLRHYNHKSTMGAAILVFSEINLRFDWDYSEIKYFPVIGSC